MILLRIIFLKQRTKVTNILILMLKTKKYSKKHPFFRIFNHLPYKLYYALLTFNGFTHLHIKKPVIFFP